MEATDAIHGVIVVVVLDEAIPNPSVSVKEDMNGMSKFAYPLQSPVA